MYSLDINFLNDRETIDATKPTAPPLTDVQFLIGGGAVAAVALAIAGGAYFVLNSQVENQKVELGRLTSEETGLTAKLKAIGDSENSIKAIEARTNALLGLFTSDVPPSSLLHEIRARTPVSVQVASMAQTSKGISLQGTAATFQDVNDFLLLLQASPFLDPTQTRLTTASLQPGTGPEGKKKINLIAFSIDTVLTPKKANEILDELEKAGSVGMVTRIKLLKEKGVIKQ